MSSTNLQPEASLLTSSSRPLQKRSRKELAQSVATDVSSISDDVSPMTSQKSLG